MSLATRQRLSITNFLARRPHRSFRRTKRRDYVRSLELPGYISFTISVWRTVWAHKKTLGWLVVVFTFMNIILVGAASQDTYRQFSDALDTTSKGLLSGGWGEIGKAGLLLMTGMRGSLGVQMSDVQQVYAAFILLVTWLTTVWLLRAYLAGQKPRLRDAIYNAGAPIVSSGIVLLVFMIQLVPIAVAFIGYSAASSTDLFSSGLLAMVVSLVGALLAVLSLYLVTSTFFALIVVTLPGMYPWQAIRTAGDLVRGRRFRLLLRLLWMIVGLLVVWAVIMLVVILLDNGLTKLWSGFGAVPLVPLALPLLSIAVFVLATAYVYLLYRKVVDDDSAPA